MYRTLLSATAGLLLVAGCAGNPAPTPEQQQQVAEEIETILTQPLADEEYAESVRCLPTSRYNSVEVLDSKHVLFKGTGGRMWLNTLRTRCIGLRRRDVLKFELRNNQACNLDTFVTIDRTGRTWMETSASCALGNFAPVTEDQVALIKAAVEKER